MYAGRNIDFYYIVLLFLELRSWESSLSANAKRPTAQTDNMAAREVGVRSGWLGRLGYGPGGWGGWGTVRVTGVHAVQE